jgi:hypothetical protein
VSLIPAVYVFIYTIVINIYVHFLNTDEVMGCCVRKCEEGDGVWAKKLKPSCRGSILAAPCEMTKGDGAEGWYGGVYEVAGAVGLCACET